MEHHGNRNGEREQNLNGEIFFSKDLTEIFFLTDDTEYGSARENKKNLDF